jgi:uncharacterized protein YecE (DUF72 family)
MKIHVGTSGYGHKEWKGTFYPEKISAKEMLGFYAARLGAVEINNTFYHMPTPSVLASWAEQVPDDFVFAVKAPQVVTHMKRLRNVFEETEYLFKTLPALGPKLGAVLFQFPKSFRADRSVLEDFLPLVPASISCAFEFRNASWFEGGILELLSAKGHSLCVADTDEAPAAEITSTAPWGYLRLRRSDYSDADLANWLERIGAQPWERAFVFFKHEEEAKGSLLAMRFQELASSQRQEGKKRNRGSTPK